MKYVVWGLVVLLIILHQDNWNWENSNLVFGFMPVTLMYHACISIAAGFVWYLATIFAWPEETIEEVVDQTQGGKAPAATTGGAAVARNEGDIA